MAASLVGLASAEMNIVLSAAGSDASSCSVRVWQPALSNGRGDHGYCIFVASFFLFIKSEEPDLQNYHNTILSIDRLYRNSSIQLCADF
jgi:hypothetical protein